MAHLKIYGPLFGIFNLIWHRSTKCLATRWRERGGGRKGRRGREGRGVMGKSVQGGRGIEGRKEEVRDGGRRKGMKEWWKVKEEMKEEKRKVEEGRRKRRDKGEEGGEEGVADGWRREGGEEWWEVIYRQCQCSALVLSSLLSVSSYHI
jgi:hypothetical protein